MQIEHVALVVKDLESQRGVFERLGLFCSQTFSVREEYDGDPHDYLGIVVASAPYAGRKTPKPVLWVMQPANEREGPLARFLSHHGPGIHHIGLEVEELMETSQRLKQNGFEFIRTPKLFPDEGEGRALLHPHGTGGILFELVQKLPEPAS